MGINIDQLSSIIKDQIKKYDSKISFSENGHVVTISDGIALISGLSNVMNGEVVSFPKNLQGMALSLEPDVIGVVLLGNYSHIKEGDEVKRTGKLVSVNVGDKLLGRVVNALGIEIDGKSKIVNTPKRPIESSAPGIMVRESVSQSLETGIIAIDALIPIGKGQRELIIGDRQTGKTTIAIDTIINQKGKNVHCVYVAIGQKNSTVVSVVDTLNKKGSMKYTTIVAANASEPDALKYIAPYAGMAIAEEWMAKGKDVLIVFDDLTKHAISYRAISLLLRRPPGREAFPGDVFYLHSRLLERSAKLDAKNGGGSITALPIIETQAGDISAYIPTNVISITDGQIFLKGELFNAGIKPAVDSGISVSRVGSAAQIKAIKKAAGPLKLKIAQFSEVEAFSQFGSDLDESTQLILGEGIRIREILKQKQHHPINQIDQAIILFSIKEHLIKSISLDKIKSFKENLIRHFDSFPSAKKLKQEIAKTNDISSEIEANLRAEIIKFISTMKK